MENPSLIHPLGSAMSPIEQIGGKALSLIKMIQAGFNVPGGFVLTTEFYRLYIDRINIQAPINNILTKAELSTSEAIQQASRDILSLFGEYSQAQLPGDWESMLSEACEKYTRKKGVAVRSSATAEDLPEASFAGQLETKLNVINVPELWRAVIECWASLWSPRVLEYRQRMGIPHTGSAMAVIVQDMIEADTSGVLFTANPLSGCREEFLVNAGYGLGEAVVSGSITPDSYRLDRKKHSLIEDIKGTQSKQIMPVETGGVKSIPVPSFLRKKLCLTREQLRELAVTGANVEKLFGGTPVDMEWSYSAGTLYLLQARAVTGLPDHPVLPDRWEPPIKGSKWIRRQVAENMPDPLSPLFDELYVQEGLEISLNTLQRFMKIPKAMDRIYNKPIYDTVNGFAYMRADMNFTPLIMPLVFISMARGVSAILRGGGIKYWKDFGLPEYLDKVNKWRKIDPSELSNRQLLDTIREMAHQDAVYWFAASLAFGTAKVGEGMLGWFLKKFAPRRNLTTGMFMRGFSSKTLEAQTFLERMAHKIKNGDPVLCKLFYDTPAEKLQEALESGIDGRIIKEDLDKYFEHYGHQTYTIDFAEPVLAETAESVMATLKELVCNPERVSPVKQEETIARRNDLIKETMASFGLIRRGLFKKVLNLALKYGPYREESLFYVGYAWPLLRRFARELGERLSKGGLLSDGSDIYYLTTDELLEADAALTSGSPRKDLAEQALYRRQLREARRQMHPPGAVPENYMFKMGNIDLANRESQVRNRNQGSVLEGFAISPGKVTAKACVILSPGDFKKMESGAIIVCPTTTPAWTPLFTRAVGLVTDIGGVLSHGSIVAREFGLPAVMGTGNATGRIKGGQVITVDGTKGQVLLKV